MAIEAVSSCKPCGCTGDLLSTRKITVPIMSKHFMLSVINIRIVDYSLTVILNIEFPYVDSSKLYH